MATPVNHNVDVKIFTHYPKEEQLHEIIEGVIAGRVGEKWGDEVIKKMQDEMTNRIMAAISYEVVIHDHGQPHFIGIKF